jgi:protein transport protein SEC61 subunit gamma-like protein
VVAPALRLDSLTNARVVVVGVTRPLPRRAPQASRLNAPDTMEVADIAVKPVKEFAKDSYRLVRKCTKPDRKEFSKIATRTGLGFIVMGFVGFFVKLILYVCHPRFLMISSRVHPRRLRGSVAFDPSNDPASRKIFLPRPLAIEAAPWGTRRGAPSERSDRVCRDHACGITTVANERPTRANASCPSLADRIARGVDRQERAIFDTPKGLVVESLEEFFLFLRFSFPLPSADPPSPFVPAASPSTTSSSPRERARNRGVDRMV